jgi:hypothetical protein
MSSSAHVARCFSTKFEAREMVAALEGRRLFTNPVVIDLLAVFTPGAAAEIGSEALLRSRLQDSVDATNRAMNNSHIAVSVRLVHVDPVTYTGQQDLYLDRTALAAGTGALSGVVALRNTYGADLVTMIVENQFGGGNAALMAAPLNDPANGSTRAFSAIAANSLAPYNYTIAHELGHNLGAGHERGNTIDPAVGPFPYSYGYRFTGGDGIVYHDLMSYAPGVEVPYYANPAVQVHGVPGGVPAGMPNEADLALTFAQTAPVVSAYRASVVVDVTPTVTLDMLLVKDGFAYITVRYNDDSGIDITTIDSNDLTLFIPGLPQITPVLDSIETPGVGGAFNRVTYRAYLRDVPLDPLSISVGVKANAVLDVTGKAIAASQSMPTNTKWTAGYGYPTARDIGSLNGSLEIGEALGDLNSDDVFRFTLAAATTVSTRLTGLTQDASVFIARDVNGDGVYQSNEIIDGSFRTGTTDDTFTLNLAAGTYYAWVFNQVVTPYKLLLRTYNDTVAPTAKLDATDITAPASQFIFNVAYDDDVEINAYTARYFSPVRVTNPFGGYYITFATAIDVDVNGPHRLVTYQISTGFTLSSSDNGLYTVSLEPNVPPVFNPPLDRYVSDGAGHPVASGISIGSFRVAIGGPGENLAPTVARVDAAEIHRGGGTTYDFDVTFADNVAVTTASLTSSQVSVTGPDGIPRTANAISVSAAPAVGSRRTVRYRLSSLPGGSWDSADYGTYTLTLVAGQIKDAVGNSLGAVPIGSFKVSVPLPGDANNNGTVEFNDLVILAQNYNLTGKTFAQGNFDDDAAGNVDFNDLVILAQRYNTTRLALAPVVEEAKPTKKRTSIDVV